MNQTNKDVAWTFISALGASDIETVKRLMTPDVHATLMGTSVLSGDRGYDDIVAIGELFPKITKDGIRFDLVSATAEDDRVSMELQGHCELVDGRTYDNQYHWLFHIRDGRVCRIKEYLDTKLLDELLAPLFAGGG